MDTGHIAQLAQDLQGKSRCVYHQSLRPLTKPHLKVDELGAGDFVFTSVPPNGFPNSNPYHSYTPDGLLLSIERPANAPGPLGEFAAAKMQGVALHSFLLAATFNHP